MHSGYNVMGFEDIIIAAGICIFCAVVVRMFDGKAAEYGVMLKIAAAVGIMAAVIKGVAPVTEQMRDIYTRSGASGEYMVILMKSLGICFLTQLASDICRDSGENTLAVQAETVGKTALLIIAVPLIKQAAELAAELIY